MGYYRSPEWRELIEAFDEWWSDVTDFLNSEGEEKPVCGSSILPLVAGLHDLTNLDTQPVWDLYLAVDGWHKRVRPESLMYEHRKAWPIERIHAMAERVILHQIELRRLGVVEGDPSTADPDGTPDGPGAMKSWWYGGIEHTSMPPASWLAAQALFIEPSQSLHADDLCSKVQPDERDTDRDKPKNWAKKANTWFRDKQIPLRISRAAEHYTLEKDEGSKKEPVRNP